MRPVFRRVVGQVTWQILLTLAIVVSVLLTLALTPAPTEFVLVGAMIVLSLAGVLTPAQALSGFASPGVMTIAALYIVVAGLRETGAMAWVSQFLLRRPKSVTSAQVRLMLPAAGLSAFVNNTPVVAMFIPIAQEWAARYQIPISKLLLPMNNLVILAGMCTLIGTSTNLAVNGLLVQTHPDAGLRLFDLAPLGVPLTLAGFLFMLATSKWLLPDRKGAVEQLENAREYSFEARVHAGGPLVGKSIAEVGLRNLKSAYVLEIVREQRLVTAVGPDEILQGNDRLTLVGVVDAVKDLRRIPGLSIAEEQTFRMNLTNAQRQLVELVLSANSPLIGKTVRDTAFRSTYQAAIISISRDGSRLPGKLGDIEFRPGDTLLVEAGPGFVQKYKYSREFLLVSPLQDSQPADFKRAPLAVAIVLGMMVAAGFEWVPLFEASFIAAGLMVLTRCITMQIATRSVDYAMVAGIAASFALGSALTTSGAAKLLGDHLTDIAVGNPMLALALVYAITVVVTEIITNNAAGVLMFPIALAVAEFAQVNYLPFVVAVMVAASAGFITPIGYQTNLMVYGPGGYHFRDFVRLGVPLSLITGAISLWLIPQIWPF